MNSEIRDYLKIGLLAVIAVCLTYGTFFKKSKSRRSLKGATAQVAEPSTPFPEDDLALKINPEEKQGSVSSFPGTTLSWDSGDKHDFGTIKQHTENVHVFKFTNTGAEPLLIENAQGSCGCTVPEYPKEPIPPGASGEIKVKYSPGSQIGAQTKTVAITSNVEPRVQNLYIYADVEGVPDPVIE
ncbi:MAG: hypothetical protein CL840_17695 [Crocinitomicaceae bacterium]|nr:hypothetical protein [Crocinitomicaceae bacterium]|tara:strand:- start:25820 stop:26371 length:552 start_codon:yes stop_codon:yes gene_type:complete